MAVQSCGQGRLTAAHGTVTTDTVACGIGSPVTVPFRMKAMAAGETHTVRITYAPGVTPSASKLRVYFDGASTATLTVTVDLQHMDQAGNPHVVGTTILDGNGKAWVGFTGSTGGAWLNQDLLNWKFTPGLPANP